MTVFSFDNNISTALASAVNSSATTITLASSVGLPTSIPSGTYVAVTLNDAATRSNFEIVYVTAVAGATLTVLRAQEGTTALSWLVGDYVYSGPTAGQMASFANINGSTAQAFSANVLYSSTVEISSGPLYLASNSYTTSVNTANTGYVQHYCLTASVPQAAVPLAQAQATFATLNGSGAVAFTASGFSTPTGISGTGSFLALLNNSATASMNLAESAYVQHYCLPATVSQAAVTLGQFAQYGGSSNTGTGTTISTSISLTAASKCILLLDGNCGGGVQIAGNSITQSGGTVIQYNANDSYSAGMGAFTALIEVAKGAVLTVTYTANYSTSGSNLNIAFRYVGIPIP